MNGKAEYDLEEEAKDAAWRHLRKVHHNRLQAGASAELKRRDELRSRLDKAVLAGNAGGTIIIVSTIGATMGASNATTYPAPLFWILLAFLSGLFVGWFAVAIRMGASELVIRASQSTPSDVTSDADRKDAKTYSRYLRGEWWSKGLAAVFLGMGMSGSMIFLFTRAT